MSAGAPFEAADVRGFLHPPDGASRGAIVLTHGAGSNCTAPLLVAVATAFSAAGLAVLRCDLPFRQRRPSGPPPRGSAALDQAGLAAAVTAVRDIVPGPLYLGGHSYGGRQATMLAAGKPDIATALLLFSYPLHPPNKPEQLRTDHFPRLKVPALFIHGETDPFGTPAELRTAIAAIPARTELIAIPNAAHDLKRGRFDLAAVVAALLEVAG